jgi:hypothetical protein
VEGDPAPKPGYGISRVLLFADYMAENGQVYRDYLTYGDWIKVEAKQIN